MIDTVGFISKLGVRMEILGSRVDLDCANRIDVVVVVAGLSSHVIIYFAAHRFVYILSTCGNRRSLRFSYYFCVLLICDGVLLFEARFLTLILTFPVCPPSTVSFRL